MIGRKFGRLTVLEDSGKRASHSKIIWKCICTCGNLKEVNTRNLREGRTKSCGCLLKPEDLTGKKFGRLTVIKYSGKRYPKSKFIWLCICDCGNKTEVRGEYLKSGITKSCGCIRIERMREGPRRMHGESKTRLHRIWAGMNTRCYRKNGDSYKHYGARGIKVCPPWLNDFLNFKSWALSHGYQKNLTIDRINHNGNYEPKNCQFLTASENSKKAWRDRKNF